MSYIDESDPATVRSLDAQYRRSLGGPEHSPVTSEQSERRHWLDNRFGRVRPTYSWTSLIEQLSLIGGHTSGRAGERQEAYWL